MPRPANIFVRRKNKEEQVELEVSEIGKLANSFMQAINFWPQNLFADGLEPVTAEYVCRRGKGNRVSTS